MTEIELLQVIADSLQICLETLGVGLGLIMALIVATTWRG